MSSLYQQFIALIPPRHRRVGTVTSVEEGAALVTLLGGGVIRALGDAQVGDRVFVRDGVIEGPAPDLPVEAIEV